MGGLVPVPVLPADRLLLAQTSRFLFRYSAVSGSLLGPAPLLLLVSTAVNAVSASPAANLPAGRSPPC